MPERKMLGVFADMANKVKERNAQRKKAKTIGNRAIRTEFVPDEFFRLPPLRDAHPKEEKPLFLAKLKYCSHLYSFESKDPQTVRKRNNKSETVMELAEYAKASNLIFDEEILPEFIETIKVNIITEIPEYDDDDDEIFKEPQFEHIGFFLNILALFMGNKHMNPKECKKYINTSFIDDLFKQLHHPDERIREGVKTIIHQFYVKFVGHRTYIRKSMRNLILTFAYEDESYRGIPHILQVLSSIVSGFSTPLKYEHKVLLLKERIPLVTEELLQKIEKLLAASSKRKLKPRDLILFCPNVTQEKVLLPLHASTKFTDFSSSMSFLMIQYAQKDPSLSAIILHSILRTWPLANTPKELELLEEVEEILNNCDADVFREVCLPLFKRLGKCMGSQHYQVAERSLYFLNKTYILALIEENIQQVMPAIVPELVQTASNHWNHSIVLLVCELLRSLMELDEDLFSELVAELDQEAESTVSVDSLERRSTARKTIQAGMNRASDLKKRESAASLSPNRNSGSKNDKYVRRSAGRKS